MEIRFVRFNIRDFLETLQVSESKEESYLLLEDFHSFYNSSSEELKTQVISYIRKSRLYQENRSLSKLIDAKISN